MSNSQKVWLCLLGKSPKKTKKMQKLLLNDMEYVLIPVKEWEEVESLLKFYLSGESYDPSPTTGGDENPPLKEEIPEETRDGVKMAKPIVSSYRERFKKQKLSIDDITAKSKREKLVQFGGDDFESINQKAGDSVFFGN